ncbi:MAG: SulP family inorganic anion transporter [Verrucomicrobiota bacterium]
MKKRKSLFSPSQRKRFLVFIKKTTRTARAAFAHRELRFFPLRKFFRSYKRSDAKADIKAGMNVALLDFPQAMAYSLIAGFPAQFGVYTSAIASTIGPMFASSRFLILGPTNATAVLVMSAFLATHGNKIEMLGVLVLLVGIFLLIGAFVKVSRLVHYVSRSVITGYITAAACLIIVNQLHNIFGFSLDGAYTFFDVLGETWKGLKQMNPASLLTALLTMVMWFAVNRRLSWLPNVAITIIGVSGAAFLLSAIHPDLKVTCLDPVPLGKLPFHLPHLTWSALSQLASSALAIAILIVLEGASIGKSLAARKGDRIDLNQQLLSQGVANVTCSFFSALPASASLTRSALNYNGGARSPMSSIVSGIMTGAAILLLGPALGFVPRAALAMLVIIVGCSLVNRHQIRVAIKSTPEDAIVFIGTVVTGLIFQLDFAVYFGVGLSLVLFLGKVATPELAEYTFNDEGTLRELDDKEKRPHPHISIIHVEGALFFGAADLFQDQIRRLCSDENLKVIILRLRNAHHLDATSVMALEELIRYMRETNRHLIVSGAMPDVYRVFKSSGLLAALGRENFFMGSTHNPNVATRNALKRAQEVLGGQKAEIRIFYDPTKANQKP